MSFVATPKTKYGLKYRYKAWYDLLRKYSPYIKRKRHKKIVADLDARVSLAADCLLGSPDLASSVPIAVRIAPSLGHASEVCLFVTFAPDPTLKQHVMDHITALAAQGVAVVLIINTAFAANEFSFDDAFSARLCGCFIRTNRGFDFAAWAHAYSLLDVAQHCQRLFLVNDSLVGPLQSEPFEKMMADIRSASADMIGLTENCIPKPHLQSYFLAINRRLLQSSVFDRLMRGIVNMPTKEAVIALYETQLTSFLRAKGFRCEALFAGFDRNDKFRDDTVSNWARLIEAGFPFIKAKVLDVSRHTVDAQQRIPERYLQSANRITR